MRRKLLTISLLLIILPFSIAAQIDSVLINEEKLIGLYNTILLSEENIEREKYNSEFYSLFRETLSLENSFEHPFDNLPTISIMLAEDESFRIFSWNLQNNEGAHSFFGFVQLSPKVTKNKKEKVIQLKNQEGELLKLENKSFNSDKWPGAIYYQIVPLKKGKQKYYTLVGWRGIDNGLTQKIIDVVYLNGENVKFGYPLFKMDKKTQRRLVFSYNAKATMHLQFNNKEQRFVFDHLAPSSNLVVGQYRFYGPDGSFDALLLDKKVWVYKADIDAKNEAKKSDIYYNPVSQPDIDK